MTEFNPSPTEEFAAESTTQAETNRQAVLAAQNIALNAFLFAALGIYLAIQTGGAWQAVHFIILSAQVILIGFLSADLIRRGQSKAGAWLLYASDWIAPVWASLLVSKLGYVAAAYTLVAHYFIIRFVMPKKTQRTTWALTVVAVLITILAELISPSWRLVSSPMLSVAPILTGILGVAFLVVIAYQSRGAINQSLRLKLTVWAGAVLAVSSIVLVAYSVITFRQAAIDSAEQDALGHASTEAGFVRAQAEIPLNTARALAQALKAVKTPGADVSLSRDEVNAMLRQVAIENPSFLATYTLWEPNAFDGLDAQYQGTEGHDETGRFIPYWVRRADGSVTVEALVAYETPVDGDWYLEPRRTKTEYTIAPLVYPVNGVDTVMATFTVPIVVDGSFYGITGVDAPITFVQELVDSIDLYDGTTDAVLLSSSGVLIGVTNHPELINQPATEFYSDFSDLQARIGAGEAFISPSPDGQFLRVFAPVDIGQTGTHWAFGLTIPYSKITAEATTSALIQVGISLTLIILALYLLWYLNGQVVRPLVALTGVANTVTEGNLESRAEVTSADEVGTLATAFNSMTSQLQETLQGLEERVAERTRNLELAAEVGRSVSQVRDLDVMLQDASELILKEFDLYYVQVYLTNPSQTTLQLQAGTGEVGAQLLERAHSLQFSTGSLNGRAAVEKRSVVIADTAESMVFRPNPLLPDTRSEMAVPLIAGDKVVGVLDMQAREPGKLNEEVLSAFEALAGQLAVAIQNASLLADAEQARAEVEAQARRQIRTNWDEHLDAIHKPEHFGFMFNHNEVTPLTDGDESPLPEGSRSVEAPISLTGESLGSLVVEIGEENQNEQTGELVNIVARQVAQQIENLRLLESAERFRHEAEQVARRQTHEGWQAYIDTRTEGSLGYLYDQNQVRPHSNGQDDATALTLPLKARDETVGKLSVQGLAADDRESFELANAVAERLGAHIESLRLFEETRRGQFELDKRAKQLAAVAQVSTASSQELNVEKMLATVVHLTQRQFGLYHAHVFTYNENTEELQIVACGYREGDEHEGTHGTTTIPVAQEQSLVARAGRTKQAVIVNDVRNEPGWLPNPLLPETRAELAVPLLVGDQLLGVLDVQSEHLNAFTEEDANIQLTLASQVAIALQNAYSFAQSQKQAERETMLNTINQKIQSATSVEAVLQIAARELGHALGAPMTIAQLSMNDKK